MRVRLGLIVVAATLAVACSLVVSQDDLRFEEPSGPGGHAGQGGLGAGGNGEAATLYVSVSTGDDSNDGLSPDSPKRSLTAATAAANGASGDIDAIHVCQGYYPEGDLEISQPVSLLGGFSCATWEREDGFDYPDFAGVTTTVIEPPASDARAARVTLTFEGPTVDADVVVEGLTIHGAAQPETLVTGASSVALQLKNGAAPRVANDRIFGGNGHGTDVGSVALEVDTDGAPVIENNIIDGGAGRGEGSAGSISLRIGVDAGATRVENNVLRGGAGVARGSAFTDNVVVRISAPMVELVRNTVIGGVADTGYTYGILTDSAHGLSLDGNRIYGGDSIYGLVYAVYLTLSDDVVLTNNIVHAGRAHPSTTTPGSAYAVYLDRAARPTLRHNTIFSGTAFNPSYPPSSLTLYLPIDATIQNNIFFASHTDADAIEVHVSAGLGCNQPISNLGNNLFFGYVDAASSLTWADNDCASDDVYVFDAEGFVVSAGGTADGNIVLRADCTGEGSGDCLPLTACANGLDCANALFEPWDTADSGLAALLASGWQLDPNVRCQISQGAVNVGVLEDFAGTPRTEPLSIGAHEQDACMP